MRAAGITALGEPVKILEVDEVAPPDRRRGPHRRRSRRHRQLGRTCQDRQLADRRPGSDGARDGGGRDGRSGRLRRGRGARRRRGDHTSAAAPASWDVDGEGARAGGDRRAPAAGGVLGSRRSVSHSGAHRGSGTRRGSRDRERRLGGRQRGRRSHGWPARSGRRGSRRRVIATASAKKAERIRGYGASEVLDYHVDWPALVREITGGGAPRAVNAAPGQAATTLKAVADGGRLATITGDPPREERGVAVSDVYVRPDGRQLSALAELLAHGTLSVPIASVRPLEQAAQALREVVAGADGAIVLSLRT